MEQDNVLAVMGSPGSGKTTTAVKLALSLAAQKKNVILVFCDPFTPVIPAILPADTVHDTSIGSLLTAPGLTQTQILNACVPIKESEYISLLGYCGGESLTHYPKITRDKVVEFFVMLRHLSDYIIIDCASVFEADPTSIIAIEMSDAVLKIGTANLKGISYFQTHSPMLADSRFRKETHKTVIGNLKVGQDWEAVSGQYGGVEYILPYVAELEQQDNELSLFYPLVQPESDSYRKAISSILQEIFSVQSASVPVVPTIQTERKAKAKSSFKLPFARSKGEF
ncbi:ATPase AAA [Lacrimispora amygdalina]|uniref:CpsD/CapB family tyrosine-protein kinase n=2 Tax=Lacrimispora TaxID=2719231 RepID=A0ABX1VU53_9FIRM|nr:ParA family protein [Lacrimispora defluvii]NNJ31964.1 CpsD/CapB family tyrosine-protein kinase [Lacrimispora defluvii]